ncbi:MAG TPA: hypothetical protein VN690_06190 [Terriglobales bacterium]|nr:hypothetical protein [Terriglobales bacterium]
MRAKLGPAIELILAFGVLAAVVHGFRGLRLAWLAPTELAARLSGLPAIHPAALHVALDGVTINGERALISPDPGARRYVLFVVRAASAVPDLAYWERVAKLLAPSRGVVLLGYCDGRKCVDALRRSPRREPFLVFGYAEYHTANVLDGARRQGECLVVSPNFAVLGAVKWSPSRPASSIVSAIAKFKDDPRQ